MSHIIATQAPDWAGTVAQLFGPFAVFMVFAIWAILFVNGILWLFLPFVLISKLNKITRRLEAVENAAEAIAKNTRPPGSQPEKPSSVSYIPGINS